MLPLSISHASLLSVALKIKLHPVSVIIVYIIVG